MPRVSTTPRVRPAMEAMIARVAAIPDLTVTSPYDGRAANGQVSADRQVAFASIAISSEVDRTDSVAIGEDIWAMIPQIDGLQVEIGGASLGPFEPPESEFIGLAFAVVVLILAFGSVLAMVLPISVAVAGVGAGVLVTLLLTNLIGIPDFATTLGAMIGLGVGIDYALIIVTRYREGLRAGLSPPSSTETAMNTAGRSVLFAGLTVVISLLGMLLIGLSFVSGLATAAAITVALTMAASLTLLPALLAILGHRLGRTSWGALGGAALIAVGLLGVGVGVRELALAAFPAALLLLVVSRFIPGARSAVA